MEGVGLLVGGLLGLLAFGPLALTLSYGGARYNERRQGTLAETNAIGTAWLRAKAIDNPHSLEIAKLLEEYGRVRKAYLLAPSRSPEIRDINQRSSTLQNQIWGHLTALLRDRTDQVTAALMTALNETFDTGTAERFGSRTRFRPTVLASDGVGPGLDGGAWLSARTKVTRGSMCF